MLGIVLPALCRMGAAAAIRPDATASPGARAPVCRKAATGAADLVVWEDAEAVEITYAIVHVWSVAPARPLSEEATGSVRASIGAFVHR